MLKLKIVASTLGATSLVLLIMGSTHLTIATAVICATVAGISATDIVLRLPSYITGELHTGDVSDEYTTQRCEGL